jgi:hypothetical protein
MRVQSLNDQRILADALHDRTQAFDATLNHLTVSAKRRQMQK